MKYERGIDACALCRDGSGRTLLVPAGDDRWTLPGGEVRHGQHPAAAVARWTMQQTGQAVRVVRALDVVTEIDRPGRAWSHRDKIVFEVRPEAPLVDGDGRGSWVTEDTLAELRLTEAAAVAVGRPPLTVQRSPGRRVSWAAVPGTSDNRRQRFAAYGFATDPAGNILLTLIADGYPGAGRWHLPGGGTDFGETAEAGLRREIVEETGQHGVIGRLVSVSHRHQPSVRGPERVSMDWHGVRVIYDVRVPEPSTPVVMDGGGSTAAAAWFPVERARELWLTEVASERVNAAVV
jgi:ADP-ribose pyrophosphatase YjhB (NUDIX family)